MLNFYPAPNVPNAGARNNYQTVTNAGQNSTSASLRYVRNFGQGGFAMGRRAGGECAEDAAAEHQLQRKLCSLSASDSRNIFLPLGGTTSSDGYGISAGYTIGYGQLTNNASLNWNRSHAMTRNYFTNGAVNPAAQAGVLVGNSTIQSNPFYYGVPTLSFGGSNAFTGLSNTAPNNSINQTISFSDFVSYRFKKHNMRLAWIFAASMRTAIGGTQVTPLGSFSFTGYATQNPAATARLRTQLPARRAGERVGLCGLSAGHAAAGRGAGGLEQDVSAGERLRLVCAGRLAGAAEPDAELRAAV